MYGIEWTTILPKCLNGNDFLADFDMFFEGFIARTNSHDSCTVDIVMLNW